jgi:VWFA-related protein
MRDARQVAWISALLAEVVFVLSLPATLGAQSSADGSAAAPEPKAPAPTETTPDNSPAKIRVESFLVTTPVTVIDKSGEFVSDLPEKDFKLLDNGATQHIERFEISSRPIALVIVVQTTDSVGSLLGQVRPLGPVFSDLLLAPDGEAAVLSFSDKIQQLLGFTSDRDRLKLALERLASLGSKPRLNDAMMQGLTLLETRPESERRIMVVFSEGGNRSSESGEPDVVRRATTDGTTIFGIELSRTEAVLRDKPDQGRPIDPLDANVARPLPPGVAPTSANSSNTYGGGAPTVGSDVLAAVGKDMLSKVIKDSLNVYARYTGGVYYTHWSENTLQDQLNRICSEVHTQYEIAYVPSNLTDSGFHSIRVQLDKPGLRVRTRAGYFYQKQVTK